MIVTITYRRTRAHLTAGPNVDLNRRIASYHGSRWEGDYWGIPIRHVRALAEELTGAGYDVVIVREGGAG